jgi:hypothetical protein
VRETSIIMCYVTRSTWLCICSTDAAVEAKGAAALDASSPTAGQSDCVVTATLEAHLQAVNGAAVLERV